MEGAQAAEVSVLASDAPALALRASAAPPAFARVSVALAASPVGRG
jgi:hypothetical protein